MPFVSVPECLRLTDRVHSMYPNPHYLFYATIEVAATLSIVVIAWRWQPEAVLLSA